MKSGRVGCASRKNDEDPNSAVAAAPPLGGWTRVAPTAAFTEQDVRKRTPPRRPLCDPCLMIEDGLTFFLGDEAITVVVVAIVRK